MEEIIESLLLRFQALLNQPLSFGKTQVTLLGLLTLFLLFGVVVLLERLLQRLVLRNLLGRTHLSQSLQFAVARIAGYGFLVLGFYLAFQMVGVDLTSLAFLAGAIGLGLGFGLQNIISNFVSGLIILAERPIALGDRVEVAGVAGQVRQINLRSTTVITNDNIAIIVPNADFITHSVTNWSHGDAKVRFRVPVGVSYDTDPQKLRQLLLEIAHEHPKALKNPEPTVFFIGFGESSMNFELAVWTEELTFSPRRFRSDLYFAIEKKLRENKIQIPFPQREVRVHGPWSDSPPKR